MPAHQASCVCGITGIALAILIVSTHREASNPGRSQSGCPKPECMAAPLQRKLLENQRGHLQAHPVLCGSGGSCTHALQCFRCASAAWLNELASRLADSLHARVACMCHTVNAKKANVPGARTWHGFWRKLLPSGATDHEAYEPLHGPVCSE